MIMTKRTDKNESEPFVKWAGGKRQLIDTLLENIPDNIDTYYEPFVGGGALFFKLFNLNLIKKAVLNDKNENLIISYNEIKNNLDELMCALSKYNGKIDEKSFYSVRNLNNATLSNTGKAAKFIYINRTCFNGLYRENSKGICNSPYGKPKNPVVCDIDKLSLTSEALQIADIKNCDFEQCVKTAQENDFVYFDPPYIPISVTSNFASYTKDSFSLDEHARLKEVFDTLSNKNIKVLLSNSDSPITRHLYKEYNIQEVYATRVINSIGSKRGKIKELLIKNY